MPNFPETTDKETAALEPMLQVLPRYLPVQPMKTLYAKDPVEAFQKKQQQPEKVWSDERPDFKKNQNVL